MSDGEIVVCYDTCDRSLDVALWRLDEGCSIAKDQMLSSEVDTFLIIRRIAAMLTLAYLSLAADQTELVPHLASGQQP